MDKPKNEQLAKKPRRKRTTYTDTFKRQVLREHFMGATYKSLVEKYDLFNGVIIYQWKCKFGSEFEELQGMAKSKKKGAGLKTDFKYKEGLSDLEAELQQAKLKVIALETLIDIAEEELGVPVRKKSGAEQPKS